MRISDWSSDVCSSDLVERALYLIEGRVTLDGTAYDPGQLLVLAPGRPVDVRALSATRVAALGGEPLDGPRNIWWNFVSSRKDRIEQAKAGWKRDRFGLPVPEETEFMPLPEIGRASCRERVCQYV